MNPEGINRAEWFTAIFDEVAEGIIIADDQFCIQFVNPYFLKISHFTLSDILGKRIDTVIQFLSDSISDISSLKNKISSNDSFELPCTFIGSPNVSDFRIRFKKDINNLSNSYICFFSNSNESPSLIEIRERDNKYRKLFENILEGIFIFNDRGVIVDANPAASRIFNQAKEELVNLTVANIFPHRSAEETYQIWYEFLRTGYLEGFYKYVLTNGEVKYIDFKSSINFLPGLHIAVFTDVTEKTKVEKALRTSEANLKAIFNHTGQQIILLDLKYNIVTFNEAAQKSSLENLNLELKVGSSIFDYGNPERKEIQLQIFERVKQGETILTEYNPRFNKTADVWIEIAYIPVFDNKNFPKGLVISGNDITDRKKAELNIQESEARFRSLVQNSSDIITILDKDTTIKYISSSVEKILGYKEDELTGKLLIDFVHGEDRFVVENVVKRISGGELNNPVLEYRFLHSNGKYVYLETTCNNLLSNSDIRGIVLNTRDVTERKHQEENLLLLERAIDSSINGIVITDPNQADNPIIYANKAFLQITGYSYFEIIGKNCRFLQGEDRNQPEIDRLQSAMVNQREVSVVLRNYRKDGQLFWNQLSISPVFNRNGDLANYIGVINDISEKKIEEDALLEISQGVSASKDQNIYNAIVTHIALRVHADVVLVGEFMGTHIKTKAMWKDGEIIDSIEYLLNETPCINVLEDGGRHIYENIAEEYPHIGMFVEEKLYSYMGMPLKDSKGKTQGILALMSRTTFQNPQLIESILNIFSIRVSAELERDYYLAALKSSEQRFKDLAKNSPDIVYIIDLEIREIVYFNRQEIFGYNTEDMKASVDWERIVHPDDAENVRNHWKQFLNSNDNATHGIEYRVRNVIGEYEWVNNRHIVLERHSDGHVRQVLLNITIITERKKAEDALKESEARLTALTENTNDILWSVDRDLIFTTMNSSFRKLFFNHFGKRIGTGNFLENALPDVLKTEWIQLHKNALKGKRFSVEFIIKDKGHDLSYEVSYNPIYSEEGMISGVSVFGRDITARKNAENDIIRTNFELDSFVYRASHDLRAPLRSVLGLINIVKSETDEDERTLYLGLAEKSINKLDTFISDLTNFSRNSRLDITISSIDFKTIIEDCLENLKYMDNAERIKAIVNVNSEIPFYSDRTRMNIIFQNIISNSIKYLNPHIADSFVKIDISISESWADIVISDNGKGIKEEYLDKIFNMFFRASQESYGSGLGLYITKQVIEKLNGAISVISELGEGTEFIIRLPNLYK